MKAASFLLSSNTNYYTIYTQGDCHFTGIDTYFQKAR